MQLKNLLLSARHPARATGDKIANGERRTDVGQTMFKGGSNLWAELLQGRIIVLAQVTKGFA